MITLLQTPLKVPLLSSAAHYENIDCIFASSSSSSSPVFLHPLEKLSNYTTTQKMQSDISKKRQTDQRPPSELFCRATSPRRQMSLFQGQLGCTWSRRHQSLISHIPKSVQADTTPSAPEWAMKTHCFRLALSHAHSYDNCTSFFVSRGVHHHTIHNHSLL